MTKEARVETGFRRNFPRDQEIFFGGFVANDARAGSRCLSQHRLLQPAGDRGGGVPWRASAAKRAPTVSSRFVTREPGPRTPILRQRPPPPARWSCFELARSAQCAARTFCRERARRSPMNRVGEAARRRYVTPFLTGCCAPSAAPPTRLAGRGLASRVLPVSAHANTSSVRRPMLARPPCRRGVMG
jgi:hypothetical protein